uniref:hypothetical protein n=1 Tax=uncultured Caulobacter sp. TaxID=158749 RepID=UPI0025F995FA
MNLLRNLVMMVIYAAAGVILGNLAGRLVLIPIAMIKPVSHQTETLTAITGAIIGAILALGRYGNSGARRPTWGVHGSAHWADAQQVKASLGGPAGLIVGRENRERVQRVERGRWHVADAERIE